VGISATLALCAQFLPEPEKIMPKKKA